MAKVLLLVGFEDPLRTDLMDMLTEWGYVVSDAPTSFSTLFWLENNSPPDCIICDNHDLAINEARRGNQANGYRLLLKLNKHPSYCDIHFGLIGWYDEHPYSYGLAKPMLPAQLCFWLGKPFTIEELIDGIENCAGYTPYGTAPQAAWKSNSPMPMCWEQFLDFVDDENTAD
jgi:hypothetical protein